MKNIIFVWLIFFSFSSLAGDIKSEEDFIKSAIKDGYQAQRNLAFGYQTGDAKTGGYDFISKNETKSCAWRKILLIANPDKVDSSDPMNERFSCRNLDFEQDEEVWKIVYKYLPMIAEAKEKGEYMVEKESVPTPDKLEIIDVTQ
ncbi:hypothetical protein [Trabulsiella odontotermitis]|uniref:hypothetical protein n=1 Tax=Trabulsiella odontotermitis TaxID=379893 RepID=UPI0006762A57|nr:hypothetical protein [Trabulsiella odontotermitis]KNC89916.1 hypothetical protein GM30_06115 [Trabulsiella odontotermitis]